MMAKLIVGNSGRGSEGDAELVNGSSKQREMMMFISIGLLVMTSIFTYILVATATLVVLSEYGDVQSPLIKYIAILLMEFLYVDLSCNGTLAAVSIGFTFLILHLWTNKNW